MLFCMMSVVMISRKVLNRIRLWLGKLVGSVIVVVRFMMLCMFD